VPKLESEGGNPELSSSICQSFTNVPKIPTGTQCEDSQEKKGVNRRLLEIKCEEQFIKNYGVFAPLNFYTDESASPEARVSNFQNFITIGRSIISFLPLKSWRKK
jgi:hypothetical protein